MSHLKSFLCLSLCLLCPACRNEEDRQTATLWYSTDQQDEEKVGPLTRAQLEDQIERNRIPPDVMVWTEQDQRWMPSWEVIDPLLDFEPPPPDAAGRAFLKLCQRAGRITEKENETLTSFVASIRTGTSVEVSAILVRHFDLLRDARRGMKEPGNVGLDYAQGFELLLPHVGEARGLARLLAADARVHIEESRISTAASDCAALARLARQIAADRTVISSTASMSVALLFAEELDHLLNQSGLDSTSREALLGSSQWLQEDDPFNLVAALRVEKVFTVAWAEKQLREGKADRTFQFPPGTGGDELRKQLAQETARSREAFDALIAVVGQQRIPDRAALHEIENRILSREFGLLANMIVLVTPAQQINDTLSRVDPVLERLTSLP